MSAGPPIALCSCSFYIEDFIDERLLVQSQPLHNEEPSLVHESVRANSLLVILLIVFLTDKSKTKFAQNLICNSNTTLFNYIDRFFFFLARAF